MSEREIKLHVEPGRRDRLLDALGRRRMRSSALSAVYFDTADGLLARHRFALRLRREDGHWVQTLKGATGRPEERAEDEVLLGATDDAVPPLDLARHRGTEVGRQLRALLRKHDRPALVEASRTDVMRHRRVLRAHGAVVEWALDEGEVRAQGRVQPISELELELKGGDAAGLYAVAQEWETLHGLWIDPVAKPERGALLRVGAPFAAPAKARRAPWSAKALQAMDGPALLRAMVRACLDQVLPNAGEIARGSDDPEHVHQLRVGVRRLRSAVRAMAPFAPSLPAGWDARLQPVFDALGDARDDHVFATTIVPRLHEAGFELPSPAPGRGEPGVPRVRALVRGAGFQGLLLALLAFAAAGDDADDATTNGRRGRGLRRLVGRLRKLARQVTRGARDFESLPFERQHQVRKRLKRLRYLAEFAAPAFDERAVRRWRTAVSRAQDALGERIDLALAGQRVRVVAEGAPAADAAAAWLEARAAHAARRSRKALERLRAVDAFW